MQKSGEATAAAAAGTPSILAHVTSGMVAYVHALAALMSPRDRDESYSSPDQSLAKQSGEAIDGQFAPSVKGCSKAKAVSNQKAMSPKDEQCKATNKNRFADPKAATDETKAAALAEQVSNLVRVHSLTPDELGLLYCYTHGGTVGQALKAIGREGEKLHDFLAGRPGFVLKSGRVEAESTMDVESNSSVGVSDAVSLIEAEVDEAVDVRQWSSVAARLGAVLGDQELISEECECVDASVRVPVPDGHLDDVSGIEVEVDKAIDVSQWRAVGVRLTDVVGNEMSDGEAEEKEDDEEEERVDVSAWGSVVVRLAATFREMEAGADVVLDGHSDDVSAIESEVDKTIDVNQWRAVGVRLTAVVGNEMSNGEEEEEKEEEEEEVEEKEGVDVNAWGSVAVRVAATFCKMEEGADVASWGGVGTSAFFAWGYHSDVLAY